MEENKKNSILGKIDFVLKETNPFAEDLIAALNIKEDNEKENQNKLTSSTIDITQLAASAIENVDELELLSVTSNNELVFALTDDDYLEDFGKEYNIDIDLDTSHFIKNPCPKNTSITAFCKKLTKINDDIYKRIKNEGIGEIVDLTKYKVVYEYSLFRGKEQEPFDSNEITSRYGVIHYEQDLLPLPGILEAVSTMKYKEEAVFWLSHMVMYGRLGILNRIPPKCDIIARFKITKLFDKEGNEVKFEMSYFEKTMKAVYRGYSNARRHFNEKSYETAIRIYQKYIEKLENTHLANEKEEREVKDYLIKMYLELALCYNKVNAPKKTCIAIRELEKLQSIGHNVKALFAKGKALMMLKDYETARRIFKSALKLEPRSNKILSTIQEVNKIIAETAKEVKEEKDRQKQYEQELAEMKLEVDPKIERYLKTLKY
ncbi:hypothetical protein PVAND_009712 [Polypedilum vanderplanki]|uniref:Uncharacterized protein n=1 Tax=Polypedilum vanderplanki TaxID=319348 RepID=A0A9J6CEI1_POLVA|nr:hypothetical protein PVAND_009712 [Polypedilum vanderplanki]